MKITEEDIDQRLREGVPDALATIRRREFILALQRHTEVDSKLFDAGLDRASDFEWKKTRQALNNAMKNLSTEEIGAAVHEWLEKR